MTYKIDFTFNRLPNIGGDCIAGRRLKIEDVQFGSWRTKKGAECFPPESVVPAPYSLKREADENTIGPRLLASTVIELGLRLIPEFFFSFERVSIRRLTWSVQTRGNERSRRLENHRCNEV